MVVITQPANWLATPSQASSSTMAVEETVPMIDDQTWRKQGGLNLLGERFEGGAIQSAAQRQDGPSLGSDDEGGQNRSGGYCGYRGQATLPSKAFYDSLSTAAAQLSPGKQRAQRCDYIMQKMKLLGRHIWSVQVHIQLGEFSRAFGQGRLGPGGACMCWAEGWRVEYSRKEGAICRAQGTWRRTWCSSLTQNTWPGGWWSAPAQEKGWCSTPCGCLQKVSGWLPTGGVWVAAYRRHVGGCLVGQHGGLGARTPGKLCRRHNWKQGTRFWVTCGNHARWGHPWGKWKSPPPGGQAKSKLPTHLSSQCTCITTHELEDQEAMRWAWVLIDYKGCHCWGWHGPGVVFHCQAPDCYRQCVPHPTTGIPDSLGIPSQGRTPPEDVT